MKNTSMHLSNNILKPTNRRWLDYISTQQRANIFYHPAWITMIAECYGYQPFVVAIEDAKGRVKAGLPFLKVNSWLTGRRWISLPFTDHCSPLYTGDVPPKELFNALLKLKSKHNVPRIEIRSATPDYFKTYENNNQVLHLLELSKDPQKVFNTFHKSQVRRNIAKAKRKGIKVKRTLQKSDLDAYYALHVKTRHRLGVPVQSKKFFKLLYRYIIKAGFGFILLAYKDSVPIAGGIFLTYKNKLIYKYGASDKDYWKFSPNHLLFWTAIRWGCIKGYDFFDWGKSDINNKGLRSFKNRWGTQEMPLIYSILTNSAPNHIDKRLSKVTKYMIRYSPTWFSRSIGKLLYKHFA